MTFLAQITNGDTTIIAIGTAAIGALTSAIVFLFKIFLDDRKECRDSRQALWVEVTTLHKKIAEILGGKE